MHVCGGCIFNVCKKKKQAKKTSATSEHALHENQVGALSETKSCRLQKTCYFMKNEIG
jgi:hypothetical protein